MNWTKSNCCRSKKKTQNFLAVPRLQEGWNVLKKSMCVGNVSCLFPSPRLELTTYFHPMLTCIVEDVPINTLKVALSSTTTTFYPYPMCRPDSSWDEECFPGTPRSAEEFRSKVTAKSALVLKGLVNHFHFLVLWSTEMALGFLLFCDEVRFNQVNCFVLNTGFKVHCGDL